MDKKNKVEKLISNLTAQLEEYKDSVTDLDVADWRYEIGVLLSANEAIMLLDILDALTELNLNQFNALEALKKFASEVCPSDRKGELDKIIQSL
jgi:hypothetical protein